MPGEHREVADVFGNQAPSIADGGIQHGFIRAPSRATFALPCNGT